MTVTLLVNQQNSFRRVAFLKNGEVMEVDAEANTPDFSSFVSLNQIYWGRVTSAGSGHVFVKLGESQAGLLPVESSFLKPVEGQALLVQVRREAMPDKGSLHKVPILTRKIVLGGRYCLFHPFQKTRVLSARIREASTLRRLETLVSPDEPFTLREAAGQAAPDHVQEEMHSLRQKFSSLSALSKIAPCRTPYDALPSSHRWMRDLDPAEVKDILIDHDEAIRDVRAFLKKENPLLLPAVKKCPGSSFTDFGVADIWDSLFQDVIPLPGQDEKGGTIVIESTAAALVIDVNQGNQQAQATNKAAIPLIVQHLKWRHIGGNILIDFTGRDKSPSDQQLLTKLMTHYGNIYNLPLSIFGWSRLGWMEARLPKNRLPLKDRIALLKGK